MLGIAAGEARSIDEIPNVNLADRTRFVSDPDGILSQGAIARADSILGYIWHATTAEPTVAIVQTLDGTDIDTAATSLFEKWGIGKSDKDNGVLILVAVDDRKAVIRTGYGVEGVLPDITCGRLLRNVMFPFFKNEDYDNGILTTLTAIREILTAPEAKEELMSKYENFASSETKPDFLYFYLIFCCFAAVAMFIIIIVRYRSTRGRERHERYEQMKKLSLPSLAATIFFLGIPILPYLLLALMLHRIRRSVPLCPNCEHKMRIIDEVHDNEYLTPAQDREEQLNSVDYDVWHCDNCDENLILPYINHRAGYSVCPNCGARAEVLESNAVVQQPTQQSEGTGVQIFYCRNCNQRRRQLYKIAKIVAPPVIITGGGFGGRGGGGFGGGFGGGSTGGGGASGGW